MAGLNRVMLIGHLGKDPEVRRTNSGDPVASLRLATSESWKDKATGERKESTEWHSVVIFNEGLVKLVEQYTRKGAKLYIAGQLRTRKWQDQSGADRYSTEIVLGRYGGEVLLLDKAERQAPDPDGYGTTRTRDEGSSSGTGSAGSTVGGRKYDDLDDEIPF